MDGRINYIYYKKQRIELYEYEDNIYMYNPQNNFFIKTSSSNKNYIIDSLSNNILPRGLEGIVYKKYNKGNVFYYHFYRRTFFVGEKKTLFEILGYLLNMKISFFLFLINLSLLPLISQSQKNLLLELPTSLNRESILITGILVISTLVITIFHEMGHYIAYSKYFKSVSFSFGLAIRYFSFVVFFTNTPYINFLTKQKKIRVIIAGVQFQIFASVILSILLLMINNEVLLLIYLQNIGLIVINLLPFLKFDGFWLISNLLDCNDYMKAFYNIILGKGKKNIVIIIMGICNILMIGFIILRLIINIWNII